ncbi:MAG: hypothetical protein ACRC33_24880 [Gemmataceae bacterium]
MGGDNGHFIGRIDMKAYLANRHRVPPEVLLPYRGRYVAWRGDGTGIAASADTSEGMDAELGRLGLDFDEVVIEYIDDLDGGICRV